jgi:hypothetical protein
MAALAALAAAVVVAGPTIACLGFESWSFYATTSDGRQRR